MSDDFETELKLGFIEEAGQLLSDAEQCFLSLESNPRDPAIIDKIFRLAHNIKGTSRAVGFGDLADFTHHFESFLLKLKTQELSASPEIVSVLLRCNDALVQGMASLKADLAARLDFSELVAQLTQLSSGGAQAKAAEPASQATEASQSTPEASPPPAPALAEIAPAAPPAAPQAPAAHAPPPTDESIRVPLSRLEKLMNNVGELVILQTVLDQQKHTTASILMQKTISQLGKITKEIQDISMGLRMVPLKQTFQKMQRIVRDTSNALGKDVHFETDGEETELDKTVLDQLADPLVHLVRNACDHGLETTEERVAAGKPAQGTVRLRAEQRGDKLVIEVSEDGRGLDPAKLRKKAVEKGILRENANLSDEQSYQLIFAPGFSTKSEVTDISGRGVGLDVVKTNVERIKGEIQLETKLGKGTTFRILLPLTLAIIEGMIVRSGEERYVIPITQVLESLKPAQSDVSHVSGMGDVLQLRGETLPLIRLASLLGRRPRNAAPAWESTAVIAATQGSGFSILVDEIIGQQQVVIKQLGPELKGIPGFSGGAILGDGRAALIVDLYELSKRKEVAA